MAMAYTKAGILRKVELAAQDMAVFYQQDFINYRGKTTDTDEHYTEIIAQWCCEHPHCFEQIRPITRSASYKTATHLGAYEPSSPRKEEIAAMQMFNYCKEGGRYNHIGKIIDYQTPLKSKRTDRAGKVDLLAYDGECLRLLELKKPDTTETMLRCVLEGFTYLETVDKEKLLGDFSLPVDTRMEACPLVFKGSVPYAERQENRPQLKRLMALVHSKPYYIQESGGKYTVTEG